MPRMDGIEACEKLRSEEKFNDTIIMFLTARGEDYSHVAAYDAGADDYVTKPVKPKVLVSKVKGLLRRLKKVIAKDINEIVFDDIKMQAINSLCEGSALNWYKENQVEMIYTYMDENDNLVTIFKIHSSKC